MLTLALSLGGSSRNAWGDGFVDDDLTSLAQARAGDPIELDELFRFMPNLAGATHGTLPAVLGEAIARFADESPEQHSALVEQIRSIARQVMASGRRDATRYNEREAALFAFFCGVHPAFVWSEATIFHDRFATFAWLGHAMRAKRALMPAEVASYVADVMSTSGGNIACVDAELARLVAGRALRWRLLRAAERRLQGRVTVVELVPAGVTGWAPWRRAS